MRILFKHDWTYVKRYENKYMFKDLNDDILLISTAKYIDKGKNNVIMFIECEGISENIQYSFQTARRLGLDFSTLQVPCL